MMRVLSFVTGLAFLQPRNPCPADQLRLLRILQIENLNDHVAESWFSRSRVEVSRLLRPPALVCAQNVLASASGSARVRRSSGDLRHQRDLRWVRISGGDVEDLVLEILSRFALGQGFGVSDQIVVSG